ARAAAAASGGAGRGRGRRGRRTLGRGGGRAAAFALGRARPRRRRRTSQAVPPRATAHRPWRRIGPAGRPLGPAPRQLKSSCVFEDCADASVGLLGSPIAETPNEKTRRSSKAANWARNPQSLRLI